MKKQRSIEELKKIIRALRTGYGDMPSLYKDYIADLQKQEGEKRVALAMRAIKEEINPLASVQDVSIMNGYMCDLQRA